MKPRRFTSKVEITHKSYLAQLLGMAPSQVTGIDLLSQNIGIELKCRYSKYANHNYACCEVEYQTFPERYPKQELYWAFLIYGLSLEPKEIPKSRVNLEPYITERVVRFMPWNLVSDIKVSRPERSGPFRYVPLRALPPDKEFILFEQDKSKLYVPKNSPLEELVAERMKVAQTEVIVKHKGNEKRVTYS